MRRARGGRQPSADAVSFTSVYGSPANLCRGEPMPRVVPSQVVLFMADRFPWLPGDANTPALTLLGMRAPFLTLSRLVKNIPPELLQMPPRDYVELEETVSTLEIAL